MVDISGEIFDAKGANADDFAKGIETAYKNKGLKALIFVLIVLVGARAS